jgi:CSLREA domain-containing protein
VVAGVSTAEFTVDTAELGNIEFFLIPNGGNRRENTAAELSGPVKVIQLGNGSWAVATANASGVVDVGPNGKPNLLSGQDANALFTETSKNAGGVDYASSKVGRNQTAATLAGDTADGITGTLAWEDLAAKKLGNGRYSKPGDADYNDAVFNITTRPVEVPNQPPVVSGPVSATLVESAAPASIDLLAGASDPDAGTILSIADLVWSNAPGGASALPAGFTLVGNTITVDAGAAAYNSLAAGQSFVAEFAYSVVDGEGGVTAQTARVTVTGTNDGPVANADRVSAAEDTPLAITGAMLTGNDGDAEGDALTVTAVSEATGGIVTLSNGDIVFTADADFSGTASFTYTVTDGNGGTAEATVSVDVTPVADQALFEMGPVVIPPPVTAGDFVVTTLDDVEDAGDGLLSLREAIALSNSGDLDNDAATVNTISFAADLSGAIHLQNDQLRITESVRIAGDGRITVDANADDNNEVEASAPTSGYRRAFEVSGTGASFEGLTITGGRYYEGGGVYGSYGTSLVFIDSAVTGNRDEGYGGGGIFSAGTLTLTNSTVSGNSSYYYGGGIYAEREVTLNSSTVSGNSSGYYGGGIFSYAAVTMTNSTLGGNATGYYGGGVFSYATISAVNSTLSGNSAVYSGGGIHSEYDVNLTDSIVFGNTGGGNEIYSYYNGNKSGTNIVGNYGNGDVFSGNTDIGDTTVEAVFAQVSNGGGVLADNGGPVKTIALNADIANPALDASGGPDTPAADARGADAVDSTGHGTAVRDLGAFEADGTVEDTSSNLVEDTPFKLPALGIALADADGSESADLVLSGFPAGTTFSIGGVAVGSLIATGPNAGGWLIEDASTASLAGLTLDPPANYFGSFTLTIDLVVTDSATFSNGAGATDTRTQSFSLPLTFAAVNDRPVLNADHFSATEDAAFVISGASLTANDSDAEGAALTITAVKDATGGVATLTNGDVTFVPRNDFSGTASFTYTVSDGNGGSASAVVTLDVAPVADEATFGPATPATPGDFVVTTLDDVEDANDGLLSLREAITLANAGDLDGDATTVNTIVFSGELSGIIHLQTDQVAITRDVRIVGDGRITVDANADGNNSVEATAPTSGNRRGFAVEGYGTDAAFEGLTITGGRHDYLGGGVYAGFNTSVSFLDSTVSGNSAAVYGGGILGDGSVRLENSDVSNNVASYGGAVSSANDVTLINTTMSGNTANGGGAIYANLVTLINSTLTGNSAQNTGGVLGFSQVNLVDSIVLGNQSDDSREVSAGNSITRTGANIIGTSGGNADVYSGNADIGDTTVGAVFAQVVNGAGVLADNGGPVRTVALSADPGNAALDASVGPNVPETDARGASAVDIAGAGAAGTGAAVRDLGAFEAGGTPPATGGGSTPVVNVPFMLAVVLGDADGSETADIVLSGFPAGATFTKEGVGIGTAGVDAGNNPILTVENATTASLFGLTLNPPTDYVGSFTLTLDLVITDSATFGSGASATDTRTQTLTLPLTFAPAGGGAGGPGPDTFVLSPTSMDFVTIDTFLSGQDHFEVSALAFGGGLTPGMSVTVFNEAEPLAFVAAQTDGFFVFDIDGAGAGALYWDATGESAIDAVKVAQISNSGLLSSADFLIL